MQQYVEQRNAETAQTTFRPQPKPATTTFAPTSFNVTGASYNPGVTYAAQGVSTTYTNQGATAYSPATYSQVPNFTAASAGYSLPPTQGYTQGYPSYGVETGKPAGMCPSAQHVCGTSVPHEYSAPFGSGYPAFAGVPGGQLEKGPSQEELAAYYYNYILPSLSPIYAEPQVGSQRRQMMPQVDQFSKAPSVVSAKPPAKVPLSKVTPKKKGCCGC